MPDSIIVGTSGAPGKRFAPVTASARRRPEATCEVTEGSVENIIGTWPPSRSVTAGPPPL